MKSTLLLLTLCYIAGAGLGWFLHGDTPSLPASSGSTPMAEEARVMRDTDSPAVPIPAPKAETTATGPDPMSVSRTSLGLTGSELMSLMIKEIEAGKVEDIPGLFGWVRMVAGTGREGRLAMLAFVKSDVDIEPLPRNSEITVRSTILRHFKSNRSPEAEAAFDHIVATSPSFQEVLGATRVLEYWRVPISAQAQAGLRELTENALRSAKGGTRSSIYELAAVMSAVPMGMEDLLPEIEAEFARHVDPDPHAHVKYGHALVTLPPDLQQQSLSRIGVDSPLAEEIRKDKHAFASLDLSQPAARELTTRLFTGGKMTLDQMRNTLEAYGKMTLPQAEISENGRSGAWARADTGSYYSANHRAHHVAYMDGLEKVLDVIATSPQVPDSARELARSKRVELDKLRAESKTWAVGK